MIPKECEKCIHCRVCAYNNPKRKRHCDFYEESRPTGEWEYTGIEDEVYASLFVCSECGTTDFLSNFCPNCGADMRERSEDGT